MKSSFVRQHRLLSQNRIALVALDEILSTVRMATMEPKLIPGIKSSVTQTTLKIFIPADFQMVVLEMITYF